jgi:hypothetical protein
VSTFYEDMAATAHELLTEFGGPAALTRVTPGSYDPDTGTTTGDVTTTWNATVACFEYAQVEIDGTRIRHGDQRAYMSVVGVVNPQTGDTLTVNGVVLNVVASRPLKPASTAVLYDVQVRGVI